MGTARLIATSAWYWSLKASKALVSPPGLTALCLGLFCGALTWFYWHCANIKMDWIEALNFRDKWRNTILGLGTLNVMLFLVKNPKSWLHRQLLYVYLAVIVITYAIIIGVYWFIIQQPYQVMLAVDCGTLIATVFIFISAIRHDTFDL